VSDGRPDGPELSLVIPFFNTGSVVRETVDRAVDALRGMPASFEIIAVSDGSSDDSVASLAGAHSGVLEIIVLERNRGKGFAVRSGMERARGRFVAFLDADGDIAPETLVTFLAVARAENPDLVYGSKRHPASRVSAPWIRRVASALYRWLVRVLFRLSIPDTQTGIKLLRKDVVTAVVPRLTIDRFAFDVELFVIASDLGYRDWVELPVTVDKRYSSTVSVRAARKVLADTLKLSWRQSRRHVPVMDRSHGPERALETEGVPHRDSR
jgi:glycosyltransferase involved in cell wall biosynthesis